MVGGNGSAPRLTPRQVEVMQLLARGDTNKQIAAVLHVSERAIKAHVSILLEKFGVHNRAGLIARVLTPEKAPVGAAERYELYADAPFIVQVLQGPEHRIAYLNRAFEATTGVSASKLIGRPVREAFPQIRAEYFEKLDRSYRTAQPSHYENMPGNWRADDGSERHSLFNMISQPLRDATGSVIGLLLIAIVTSV